MQITSFVYLLKSIYVCYFDSSSFEFYLFRCLFLFFFFFASFFPHSRSSCFCLTADKFLLTEAVGLTVGLLWRGISLLTVSVCSRGHTCSSRVRRNRHCDLDVRAGLRPGVACCWSHGLQRWAQAARVANKKVRCIVLRAFFEAITKQNSYCVIDIICFHLGSSVIAFTVQEVENDVDISEWSYGSLLGIVQIFCWDWWILTAQKT